ncbi:13281_t:CDS:1, partial [Funneliformis mosseae]
YTHITRTEISFMCYGDKLQIMVDIFLRILHSYKLFCCRHCSIEDVLKVDEMRLLANHYRFLTKPTGPTDKLNDNPSANIKKTLGGEELRKSIILPNQYPTI